MRRKVPKSRLTRSTGRPWRALSVKRYSGSPARRTSGASPFHPTPTLGWPRPPRSHTWPQPARKKYPISPPAELLRSSIPAWKCSQSMTRHFLEKPQSERDGCLLLLKHTQPQSTPPMNQCSSPGYAPSIPALTIHPNLPHPRDKNPVPLHHLSTPFPPTHTPAVITIKIRSRTHMAS